jgi:hypothetical protein
MEEFAVMIHVVFSQDAQLHLVFAKDFKRLVAICMNSAILVMLAYKKMVGLILKCVRLLKRMDKLAT